MADTWQGTADDEWVERQALEDGRTDGIIHGSGPGSYSDVDRWVTWQWVEDHYWSATVGDSRDKWPTKAEILADDPGPQPSTQVPGLALSRDPGITGPVDHDLTWTAITDSQDNRFEYDVDIEWYLNGSLDHSQTVAQASNAQTRVYSAEDDVHCRARYINRIGPGPWDTTSTV